MADRASSRRARLTGAPRVLLAVLLLVCGGVGVVVSVTPVPTSTVVLTVHAVVAGAVISAADVHEARRARSEIPERALTSAAAAVGQRTVSAVGAGEIVTAARLTGSGFDGAVGPGRTLASVRVAAAAAGLVHPGNRVDVVVAGAASPTSGADEPGAVSVPGVLATDAVVLAVWLAPGAGDGGFGGTGNVAGGGIGVATVVLTVDAAQAPPLLVLPSEVLVGLLVRPP